MIIRVEFTPFDMRVLAYAVKFLNELGCTIFSWSETKDYEGINFVEGRKDEEETSCNCHHCVSKS